MNFYILRFYNSQIKGKENYLINLLLIVNENNMENKIKWVILYLSSWKKNKINVILSVWCGIFFLFCFF